MELLGYFCFDVLFMNMSIVLDFILYDTYAGEMFM